MTTGLISRRLNSLGFCFCSCFLSLESENCHDSRSRRSMIMIKEANLEQRGEDKCFIFPRQLPNLITLLPVSKPLYWSLSAKGLWTQGSVSTNSDCVIGWFLTPTNLKVCTCNQLYLMYECRSTRRDPRDRCASYYQHLLK